MVLLRGRAMRNRRFLSPRQFAEITGLSIKTVRRRLKAGLLPSDQSGGHGTLWRIDYDAFLQSLAATPCMQSGKSAPSESISSASSEVSESICGPSPKWLNGHF